MIETKFKNTEIGLIPEDWQVKTIGEVADKFIGLTYTPNDVRQFGTLVLRSSNIQNGQLCYEDNVFVQMDIPTRAIVKKGDILICVRNGSKALIGKSAIIDDYADGMAFGAFMSILRPHSVNNLFCLYIWQSPFVQNQINELLGATINQITNSDFDNIFFPLPPLPEQRRIAEVLSQADELIKQWENVIAKKRDIKTATMQLLLTGKKRLNGFKDEWVEKKLGEVVDVRDGTHDTPIAVQYGYPLVTSKNLDNGTIDFADIYMISKEDYEFINKRSKVDKGDILYAMIGTLGNPVLIDFEPNFAIKNVALFKNINKIDSKYLQAFLDYDVTRTRILGEAKGSNQKFIPLSVFRHFHIYIPPTLTEQRAIAEILSDMDEEIKTLEAKVEKLRNIKSGMMQQLLSGKIRLTGDDADNVRQFVENNFGQMPYAAEDEAEFGQ